MKTKRLGRTGLKVSEICLGAMTFGNQCDEATSFAIMDKAFDAGVYFFDTADVYPLSETPETRGSDRTDVVTVRVAFSDRSRIRAIRDWTGPNSPTTSAILISVLPAGPVVGWEKSQGLIRRSVSSASANRVSALASFEL